MVRLRLLRPSGGGNVPLVIQAFAADFASKKVDLHIYHKPTNYDCIDKIMVDKSRQIVVKYKHYK